MIKCFIMVVMCAIATIVRAADYQGDYMLGIIPQGWEERSCEKIDWVELDTQGKGGLMWVRFESSASKNYGFGVWARKKWNTFTNYDRMELYSKFQYAHLNNKPINNNNMIKQGMWCRVSKEDRYEESVLLTDKKKMCGLPAPLNQWTAWTPDYRVYL